MIDLIEKEIRNGNCSFELSEKTGQVSSPAPLKVSYRQ
jgi:hypothetical protein